MSTKREKTREEAAADILDAAVFEIAEKGYGGATIRSIAARAGVANGLVCKYFGSKEEMLNALIDENRVEDIYGGVGETDPYTTFILYMDAIRALQKSEPAQFEFLGRIFNGVDFPESTYKKIRGVFEGSEMEAAILRAQADGDMIKADAFGIFVLFSEAVVSLLGRYADIGAEPPSNDAILNIIGYNRKEQACELQHAE